MQVWFPHADFEKTARVLYDDDLMLNLRNAERVLLALSRGTGPFSTYPGVRMWAGHYMRLKRATLCLARQAHVRGLQDLTEVIEEYEHHFQINPEGHTDRDPKWWGRAKIHISHRTYLCARDARYLRRWPKTPTGGFKPVWPVALPDKSRRKHAIQAMERIDEQSRRRRRRGRETKSS